MDRRFPKVRLIIITSILILLAAAWHWRGDILQTTLDPKVPYQTYKPPKAANYGEVDAWLLHPDTATPSDTNLPVDVFFIAPTAFAGGDHWNTPLNDPKTLLRLNRNFLPNYAGPFAELGRTFAPHYRQASVYAFLTNREDAREARLFAYKDIARAFQNYLSEERGDRPFILVGVEQGGLHATRLLSDFVAGKDLQDQLVAAYILQSPVPEDLFQGILAGLRPCETSLSTGCIISWAQFNQQDKAAMKRYLERGYVWNEHGSLSRTRNRNLLCINPILWKRTSDYAPARQHLGGVNATGLEAGASPPPLPGQTSAQCVGDVLLTDPPRAPSLHQSGGWLDQKMLPSFNLFYADLKRDAERRTVNWHDNPNVPQPVTVLDDIVEVEDMPTYTID